MKIPTVNFLGISFVNLSGKSLLDLFREAVDTYETLSVCYVDEKVLFSSLLSKQKREQIEKFSVIIPRGGALIRKIASRYPDYAYTIKETPDLVSPLLAAYKDTHHSFMFFGGSQLGLNKLGINLQASFPGVTFMGLYSEAFVRSRADDIRAMIHKGDVRVIYLGMGSPKDEAWVLENPDVLKNKVTMCIDKDIRGMSGEINDIPLSVRRKGGERMYLFFRNPLRIFLFYRPLIVSICAFFEKLRNNKPHRG